MAKNGNRRLRGDAIHFPLNVAVEHDIADHENAQIAEAAFEEAKEDMEVRQHEPLSSHLPRALLDLSVDKAGVAPGGGLQ